MTHDLARLADRLRQLHAGPGPLILPNAWDVASARAFAALNVSAIATTSAGVAESLGYEDGETAPADAMLAAVASMAAAIGDLPLTADLEGGYGLAPRDLVDRLLATGAVGLNLEDTDHRGGGLLRADAQAQRIAAVKAAGHSAGVDIVVNARVDVFIREVGAPETRMDEALRRARRYVEAGADCVYPIWLADETEIATFVAGVAAPVNIYARDAAPPIRRLAELGVRRVTFGSGLFQAAMTAAVTRFGEVRRGSADEQEDERNDRRGGVDHEVDHDE
ncbi:MAG: isocitrate lyase/phosphoenolpyruvate mutase family protein [Chloroflexota bacterium]